MLASLVSMRNMLIIAALALLSLGGNAMQQWHLWKVEAAAQEKYDSLADVNKANDKMTQDIAKQLAACVGKATASDTIARDAIQVRDDHIAELQKLLSRKSIQKVKIYETPDCKAIMDSGICPAVSDGLRLVPDATR
jgi:hypothetical protein